MKKSRSSGFTLIELLVVIAIIGILSAVVLASLNTARSKGNDAAVMSNIDGIRTQAGIYSSTNGNYGTGGSGCGTAVGTPATLFGDQTVINQVTAVKKANSGGTVTCNVATDGSAYAVSAALVATPGTFYCVDSAGVATTTTSNTLSTGNTSC
ncbi:MAG: type II secretion system protein [Minisyncoccota bacterium]